MKKILEILKIILLFILILFIIFFSIMNSEIIKINFDFFPFNFIIEMRVFLLIILCFSLGFVSGIATTSYKLITKYFESLKNKKIVKKLENDLKKMEINKNDGKENE